jgi:hypothetical protein
MKPPNMKLLCAIINPPRGRDRMRLNVASAWEYRTRLMPAVTLGYESLALARGKDSVQYRRMAEASIMARRGHLRGTLLRTDGPATPLSIMLALMAAVERETMPRGADRAIGAIVLDGVSVDAAAGAVEIALQAVEIRLMAGGKLAPQNRTESWLECATWLRELAATIRTYGFNTQPSTSEQETYHVH